jgi:MFS transporter, PHS family, inorganic phosphate transporter
MLGYLYFQGQVPTVNSDVMKGSQTLGMIIGQIAFGVLSDAWGRHTVYGKELMITMFGTLMVILLPWHGLSDSAITAWISVFRVVAGVGIGAGMSLKAPWYFCLIERDRLSFIICVFS